MFFNKVNEETNSLEVDLYFDGNKSELKMCIVGNMDPADEIKIWKIPKGGYVPHVMTVIDSDMEIRCAKIVADLYGQDTIDIFN